MKQLKPLHLAIAGLLLVVAAYFWYKHKNKAEEPEEEETEYVEEPEPVEPVKTVTETPTNSQNE